MKSQNYSTEHRHFILNKPFGFLSQFISNQKLAHKKKYLGELFDFPERTMAIGRLDEPSEGLLLLSTDGRLSDQVRSRKVEKEYWVQLDGNIPIMAINELRNGVCISIEGKEYITRPAKVASINHPSYLQKRRKNIREDRHGPTSWISITISEGKYRQVRKMTAAVGYPCLRLIRVRIGRIKLQQMEAGDCIEVPCLDV